MLLLKKILYRPKYFLASFDVEKRWWLKERQKPNPLPSKLVISLTSYPARFQSLERTLLCLLRQTIKPDHIILWLAKADLAQITTAIHKLKHDEGLEVRPADDMGAYKKILPSLASFPDAFIATADDDLYYHSTWLEEMVTAVDIEEKIIPCHRAHEITLTATGEYRPYDEWVNETRFRGIKPSLFPTGGAGALYQPGILQHSPEDREDALSLCPKGDDTWLYWIGRRNGARYKTVGKYRDLITWRGSQKTALWQYNIYKGGNDEQIRKIAAKYGYPPIN